MRSSHLSSNVSRRGAGRVSIVWVIAFGLLAAIGGAYGFIGQDEAAQTEKLRVTAVADKARAEGELESLNANLSARSVVLGFTPDPQTTPSNVESANSALAELKDAFPDMDPVDTYQDAVPSAIKSYRARVAQVATLNARITELDSQVAAERSAKSSMQTEKDARIATLDQELSDERETARSRISSLESSNAELTSRNNQVTDRVTELQDDVRTRERSIEEGQRNAASTKLQYTKRLDDIVGRSEKADGEISAVASQFGIGFINLSSSDRLSEGTVFRIVSGRPGSDLSVAKARARVINVGARFSEVEIYDVADRFQPVVAGDKIYNPLYESKGQRNAVLAGSISGAYNKAELTLLFTEIGINIQDEISNTTDFLITGGPLFVDEDGEALELPMPVEQLPVYGAARDQGITIIPIRDVLQYFER